MMMASESVNGWRAGGFQRRAVLRQALTILVVQSDRDIRRLNWNCSETDVQVLRSFVRKSKLNVGDRDFISETSGRRCALAVGRFLFKPILDYFACSGDNPVAFEARSVQYNTSAARQQDGSAPTRLTQEATHSILPIPAAPLT